MSDTGDKKELSWEVPLEVQKCCPCWVDPAFTRVNYRYIAHAIDHYTLMFYKYIEVPWIVSWKAIEATLPDGCSAMRLEDKAEYLVGSAEQSFIQMMMEDKLSDGQYMACTPCFRDERELNNQSRLWFMKVELINKGAGVSETDVQRMAEEAAQFMNYYADVKIVKTDAGLDIVSKDGLELGSYGLRKWRGFRWIYGTGLAEPRLSIARRPPSPIPMPAQPLPGVMIAGLNR